MASEDPNDRPLSRYTFVQWLQGIIQSFNGQNSKQFLLQGGGTGLPGVGDPPPVLALAARTRYRDNKNVSPYYSRMEEAKRKQAIWDNDIRPVLEERLKHMFHAQNYARMKLIPHVSTNLMRRIVQDVSILYQEPARREYEETPEEEVAEEQKADAAVPDDDDKAEGDSGGPAPDTTGGETADAADQPPSGLSSPGAKRDPEAQSNIAKADTGTPEVDELAQYLKLDNDSDEDGETDLDKLQDATNLDITLDVVEKLCRIHDAVWVMPKVSYDAMIVSQGKDGNAVAEETDAAGEPLADPDSGKLGFLIFTPDCADVIEDPDDPSRALAWFYASYELNNKGEQKQVWNFFTNEDYWKFDSEWHTLGHQPNPLGRLPVSVFRKEKPSTSSYYVNGCGRDLFEGTLELCVLKTIQNARFKDSGFKQMVIIGGDEKDVPADQVMGGPTPIYVPDGGGAEVLDLQPMIKEMTEMIKDRADELRATYGSSGRDMDQKAGIPQSGFAKKMDMGKVLQENKRIRKFFKESEQDLYELTAMYLKEYPISSIPALDETKKLTIDWAEYEIEEDPKNQNEADAIDLKLNKKSLIDILKRDNPDLNELELLELAERNRQINKIFLKGDQLKLLDLLATAGKTSENPQAAADLGAGGAPGAGAQPVPGAKPAFGGKGNGTA